MVENLGHSATAYEAAKLRLERKYSGKRRALTLRMEELDAFKPIRDENEKDLEGLAELLEAIVVNLTDAGQQAELGSGSLYITIQWKLGKNLLAKYKQWLSDNYRDSNVQTELRLEGSPHELIVNVLNGRHTALDTSLVEFVINSLDGSTS